MLKSDVNMRIREEVTGQDIRDYIFVKNILQALKDMDERERETKEEEEI